MNEKCGKPFSARLFSNTKWASKWCWEVQASLPFMLLKMQGPLTNEQQATSSAESISVCGEEKSDYKILFLTL